MKGCFHITLVIACVQAATILQPESGDAVMDPENSFQDAMETSIVNLATSEDEMDQIPSMEEMKQQTDQTMAKIKNMIETLKAGKVVSVEPETDKMQSVEDMKKTNDQREARIKAMLKNMKAGKVMSVESETDKRPSVEHMKQVNDQREANIKAMLKNMKAGQSPAESLRKVMSVESETDKRPSVDHMKQVNDQREANIKAMLKKMQDGKPIKIQIDQRPTREDMSQRNARNDQMKAKFREMIKRMQDSKKLRSVKMRLRGDIKKDDGKFHMPVKRQIPTAEMDEFVKKLSPGCGKAFVDMQAGKGGLHTFGSEAAPANAQGCEKLGGSLCFTDASITKTGMGGAMMRKMMSTTSSSGNSCLPRQCVSTADLSNVASFMQGQVLTIIPGDAHKIKLHVDCTKSGGDDVTVGDKSGTAVLAPTTMVLAAVLVVSQFAFMGW